MITNEELAATFEARFGTSPILSRAPGRINIIGEHTDYNEGFVLPAAIDRYARMAIQTNESATCNITAMDLEESASFSLDRTLGPTSTSWLNYVLGVVDGFQKKKVKIAGFDLLFTSNVPVGAGVSSSAAIESGLGVALNTIFNAGFDAETIALIGQRAEHEFVGVNCGIMDQFASVFGKQDQVIRIDCRTQEREYFPADFGDYQIVLINSNVKHELVSSAYNVRREQCEAGVAAMQKNNPVIRALRDARLVDIGKVKADIDEKVYDRCKYVIDENDRVLEACNALNANNIARLGELMYQTHDGLSRLYEVSCSELDLLVDLAREEEAVIGSRMMGGGFGGCTINLIRRSDVDKAVEIITAAYKLRKGIDAAVYKLNIVAGAAML